MLVVLLFQPTPPRGGRRQNRGQKITSVPISTHAPTRGATVPRAKGDFVTIFQPTPPRGGRPGSPLRGDCTTTISTHAPTRGATWRRTADERPHRISTHAPTRGATFPYNGSTGCHRFQPTPPRGGRQQICTIFSSYFCAICQKSFSSKKESDWKGRPSSGRFQFCRKKAVRTLRGTSARLPFARHTSSTPSGS